LIALWPPRNRYLAAQSLGLGSPSYTEPVASLNANYTDRVGIPTGYVVVAVVKIGSIKQNVDALSSASRRKANSEIFDYH
jgi:nitroreductase